MAIVLSPACWTVLVLVLVIGLLKYVDYDYEHEDEDKKHEFLGSPISVFAVNSNS